MDKVLQTPDFKTEEEEALWWDQNQDLVLQQFEQAAKDGALRRSDLTPTVKPAPSKPGSLQPAFG